MTAYVFILLGLVLLTVAGDALVRGAVALSLRLGVPALIVSLTIVSIGTSAPELFVSVQAALEGAPGIALGNVVGSNIANVLLVLGLPALFTPILDEDPETKRNFKIMAAASLLLVLMSAGGGVGRLEGVLLLALTATVLFSAVRSARAARVKPDLELDGAAHMPVWKLVALLVGGVVGLPLGAHFLVEGARVVALGFGLSEAVIGLTLVAVGTSLPELAATVAAAVRGRADVAMGNVIGSNLFNILLIVGATSVISPIPVEPRFFMMDFPVMAAALVPLWMLLYWRKPIDRRIGALFVAAYAAYAAVALAA